MLLIAWMLFWCAQRDVLPLLPSERIVRFSYGESTIGYGVKIQGESIVTATHVLSLCREWDCVYEGKRVRGTPSGERGEVTIIWAYSGTNIFEGNTPKLGDAVYILRSHSWSWKRTIAHIRAVNVSYIGYDRTLSWIYQTGALQIDLALEEGESGLPVWTLSGELVWVVSASDAGVGKSYVVK